VANSAGKRHVGVELTGFESDVARRRARELLADVGLDDAADRYPSALSGGMRQRVGLARALAVDPLLLLLDEPFNSLDVQTRSRLHRLLLEVWRETRQTVVFITHDIREAVTLADRIVVVSDQPGRVVDDVSIDLKRPRDTTGVAFNDVVRRLRSQLGVGR
jgi:NitT/TauT family transport system ATP-binding protein